MLRQIIVTHMGHVDHGKTSLLDNIRGTAVAKGEAGGITQNIGSTIVPIATIKKIAGDLLKSLNKDITLPGVLFIDSPGHAAFTNLRKRGGSLSDIVILVIDINDGPQPQTLECLEILKSYKTPFIIALNKIDTITGWEQKSPILLANIAAQNQQVQTQFEGKLYEVVGKLAESGFQADRFDRVSDYTQQIALVPTSAHTGEGISELMMVLTGLAEKFLEEKLSFNAGDPAKGTILEVKEQKGLGKTLDIVLYDGTLHQGDTVAIGSLGDPIVTKVKALMEPAALSDTRDKKSKFKTIKSAVAATGVRVCAPNTEEAVSGMPIRGMSKESESQVVSELKEEVSEVLLETDDEGIVIKADSLGSLEALEKLLREHDIKIKRASIGNITKKDVAEACANQEKDELMCAVIGFNVDALATDENVKIITGDIIYSLIDNFTKWQDEVRKKLEAKELDTLCKPAKIKVMKGYVFRQSNPAVCGCDILAGELHTGTPLMKQDGRAITEVKGMQHDKENIDKAQAGKQVAVSMPSIMIGRQVHEDDILYSAIPEQDFKKLKGLKKYLSPQDVEVLKEIAHIMREHNPVWGI